MSGNSSDSWSVLALEKNEDTPTHLDLFSGIGGFALAAALAGFRTVAFCEIDAYCQAVIKARFGAVMADTESERCGEAGPSRGRRQERTAGVCSTHSEALENPERDGCAARSPSEPGRQSRSALADNSSPQLHGDIRTFDGTRYAGTALLTGGFPCQPFSVAGKRGGSGDDRFLWPEMLRVISEAKPAWIVGENVAGIVNMELDRVLSDLEGQNYECWPLIIPACAVDARHRRDRVWIVAHAQRPERRPNDDSRGCSEQGGDGQRQTPSGARERGEVLADTNQGRIRRAGPQGQTRHVTQRGQALANTGGTGLSEPEQQAVFGAGRRNERRSATECCDGKFESKLRGVANELPKGLDKAKPNYIMGNANPTKSRTGKVLPVLQKATAPETVPVSTGGHDGVLEEEILRSTLHGQGDDSGSGDSLNASQKSKSVCQIEVREVSSDYEFRSSPFGRESKKQCPREPDDVMRILSREVALGEWENASEEAIGLQSLRCACAEIGYVPKTLSALREVWRSLSYEEASWVALRLITGNPFHAEWPGVGRIASGVKKRADRLKALGNAIVPEVAFQIIQAIRRLI